MATVATRFTPEVINIAVGAAQSELRTTIMVRNARAIGSGSGGSHEAISACEAIAQTGVELLKRIDKNELRVDDVVEIIAGQIQHNHALYEEGRSERLPEEEKIAKRRLGDTIRGLELFATKLDVSAELTAFQNQTPLPAVSGARSASRPQSAAPGTPSY